MTRQELFDAMSQPSVVAGLFVEIMLEKPVRVYSGIGNATTPDGKIWSGMGGVGRVSAIETTEKIEAPGFAVGFQVASGMVDGDDFADLMAAYVEARKTPVVRREITLAMGVFDDAGNLLSDALIPWGFGVGSKLSSRYAPGEGLAMTLECEGRLAAAFPPVSLVLNDPDQKRLYPGDRGLEGVGPLARGGRLIVWRAAV